jgi:hypothetical protein
MSQFRGTRDFPSIEVRIGAAGYVCYYAVQTSAPIDYDGFGTIELSCWEHDGVQGNNKRTRVVLVRGEHLNWQTARYSSGNHYSGIPDYCDMDDVEQELWKRLAGKAVRP